MSPFSTTVHENGEEERCRRYLVVQKRFAVVQPWSRLAPFTLRTQRALLLLQAVQFAYIGARYFISTANNRFPVLESLFRPEISSVCTDTGCWQSMVPFPGSLYCSILLLCVLALLFRPGLELRIVLVFLSSTQIFMGIVRVAVVPDEFYPEGVAMNASAMQFAVGTVLLVASGLPYPEEDRR